MKRLIFALTMGLTFAFAAVAQETCKTYPATGVFSFCPPAAWVPRDEANNKYKQFFAAEVDGFTANINFKEAVDASSLNEVFTPIAMGVLGMQPSEGYTNIRMVYLNNFTTASGEKGIKATYHVEYKGHSLASIHYLFAGPGNLKLLVAATVAVGDTATERLAEASIRTLKFKR